ncbi:IclR family transcriptional regulator [Cryobacterium psychrophilum]|uniref:IclR family transcriptional regulator n=1 Tax=Cryobacterium psychrophilum TaxID=41988 RepID=UPI0010D33A8C|nr:helix-turn-helix domain-containing protein [Cryobacterium psychrophilum]TDW29377.1 IclR family transcriptional regulator [Cryobacterium psychrophilum]
MRPESLGLHPRQPKAIHNALTVLEEVARCGAGVTARQISDNLTLARATAYRLLNVLVEDEYLVRTPDLSGFALGRRVVEFARLVTPTVSLPPEAVRVIMERLRGGIRGGIHLVRYENDCVRIIDGDPDFPPSDQAHHSGSMPASAMGRLLLFERDRCRATPARGSRDEWGGPEALAEIAELGYARQSDGMRVGYTCIAVPIRDSAGLLIGGLCGSAPHSRIQQPVDLVALLHGGALELTPLLA